MSMNERIEALLKGIDGPGLVDETEGNDNSNDGLDEGTLEESVTGVQAIVNNIDAIANKRKYPIPNMNPRSWVGMSYQAAMRDGETCWCMRLM